MSLLRTLGITLLGALAADFVWAFFGLDEKIERWAGEIRFGVA